MLGTVAVATKHEIALAIIGGLFVLEMISVIVQVVSFKLTGKRIFKMAPIHHHFEQLGWTEPQIVIRFWIISIVLALAGVTGPDGSEGQSFAPVLAGKTETARESIFTAYAKVQRAVRDDRWKLWAPAITSGLAGPVFAMCMLTPDFTTMVAALALTSFLVGFHLGPIFAIAQTVARPSMRALASAIILLTATCFGQGVGPLAVGMINDALKHDYGTDAVRYSLLSAAATTTLGALLFIWAPATIRDDIKRAT